MKQKVLLFIIISIFTFSCEDCDKSYPSIVVDPIDAYEGEFRSLELTDEIGDFRHGDFICSILAPDGTIIERKGEHVRLNQVSHMHFAKGLKEGIYRLLSLKVETSETKSGEKIYQEYGLGCRIEISSIGETKVLDTYNSALGFLGRGTEDHPYIVCSSDHFKKLRNIINNELTNDLINKDTYFKQYGDIDMDYISWKSDNELGWLPIGSVSNNPFRGHYDGNGYSILNLWSNRPNSSGIGLFGFVESSVFSNITMESPQLTGGFATGSIVGSVISPGDEKLTTIIRGCQSQGGMISAPTGMGTGGLLGAVDMKSSVLIDSCCNQSTAVAGAYGVGGLLGVAAFHSTTVVSNSNNIANIESTNTGAGGLVGSVDTLVVMACENYGEITGSTRRMNNEEEGCYGTGGLVGGSGPANIYASTNKGDVTGYVGVGGIVGSSRIGSEELMFNNISIKTASNTGMIKGESSVGGICGEAQLAGYALYNTASVEAIGGRDSHVGGIAGNTSIALIYNAVNTGTVSTDCTSGGAIGGIVSKSNWASLLTCQNFGSIDGEPKYMGGVIALAGNNSMINFCSNVGNISTNSSDNVIGGIVGSLGDQREWTAENISACVFGAMDIALGILGPTFARLGKTGAIGHTLTHILHYGELTTGLVPLVGEYVLFGIGVDHMINLEAIEVILTNTTDVSLAIESDIRQEMDQVRWSKSIPTREIFDGLRTNTLASFTENIISLNKYNESSDENNELINENMNLKREERMEYIEHSKETQEIVQKVVSGVCMLTITIATVASFVATSGTTAAVAASIALPIASVVGGTNAIIEGVTDYPENAVIVSQCANYGSISAKNKENIGGVVGVANENCWIKDCMNVSTYNGPVDNLLNSVIGTRKANVKADRCLMIGNNWSDIFAIADYRAVYESSAIYNTQMGDEYIIQFNDLYKVKTFKEKGWDISSAVDGNKETKWVVREESGYHPVPQRSEMTDEIEEHN